MITFFSNARQITMQCLTVIHKYMSVYRHDLIKYLEK